MRPHYRSPHARSQSMIVPRHARQPASGDECRGTGLCTSIPPGGAKKSGQATHPRVYAYTIRSGRHQHANGTSRDMGGGSRIAHVAKYSFMGVGYGRIAQEIPDALCTLQCSASPPLFWHFPVYRAVHQLDVDRGNTGPAFPGEKARRETRKFVDRGWDAVRLPGEGSRLSCSLKTDRRLGQLQLARSLKRKPSNSFLIAA